MGDPKRSLLRPGSERGPSMRPVEAVLVPARFFAMLCHLVASFLVFYTMEHNILASMPQQHSSTEYNNAETEMRYYLAAAMLCFIVQLFGLLSGFTKFTNKLNSFHVWINVVGFAMVIFFSLENWRYQHYGQIVGFCSILPATVEFLVILISRVI